MLKVLIRCSVLVSMLLLLVMVDAYELQRDDAYPDGAQQRILLSMTQSDLPREQVLEGLASIPEDDEWIAKAVPDPEDFMGRRSLAVFGPGGTHTGPVDWYSTRITGEHLSPEQLGDANLSGLYYAQLSEDSLNELRTWAQPHQITVEVDTVGLPAVLYQTVIGNGFGFSLLACVIIVVVGLLAWVVNRSTVRVVRTVSGVPSPRLHRLELLQLARMLLPWIAVLWLAGVGLVAVTRGAGNAASFAGTSALATLAFILGLAVIYGISVWWSTPTRQIISQRRPAVQGQFGLSAGLKLLGLLVVAVSIPVTVASLVATVGLVTGESRWSTFGEDVGIRVTTASEEEFQDTKDAFQRLVAEQESQGNLDVAYSFTPEPLGLEDFGPYDGVILVNGAFAQRWEDTDAAALRSIPAEEADRHVVEMVEESLPLWVQDGRGLQDLQLRVVADPDAAGEVPVLSSTGTAELELMRHPLVMVAPEYSEVFNAGFTGSLLSSQNILFRDPQALWEGIAEQELEGNVLSVDRVADAGAVRTQSAAQLAVIQGISLALLTAALLSSTAISAHIHCVSAQRETFLRRSAGMRWRRVHRRVLSVDAAASAAVAGLCLVALVALHVPFAWLALAVPVVFILGDGLLLARSGQRQMDSITERTI